MASDGTLTQAPGGPEKFGYMSLDSAPKGPGIYAWYLDFPGGPADWLPHVIDGRDVAVDSVIANLQSFSEYYRPRTISLRGTGDYQSSWKGGLEAAHISDSLTGPQDTVSEPGDGFTRDLSEILHSPAEREAMAHAFKLVAPVFTAPIYIGVATDLRDRLSQHKADYESAYALMQNDSNKRSLLVRSPKLGARLAAAGIPVEDLAIWTLRLQSSVELQKDRRRAVAKTMEYFLQRIFRPVFGRR